MTTRITISVPDKVASDLNYVCSMLGVSRSGFMSAALSQSLPSLRSLIESLPNGVQGASQGDAVRFRGAGVEALQGLINSLSEGGQDDLFL